MTGFMCQGTSRIVNPERLIKSTALDVAEHF